MKSIANAKYKAPRVHRFASTASSAGVLTKSCIGFRGAAANGAAVGGCIGKLPKTVLRSFKKLLKLGSKTSYKKFSGAPSGFKKFWVVCVRIPQRMV